MFPMAPPSPLCIPPFLLPEIITAISYVGGSRQGQEVCRPDVQGRTVELLCSAQFTVAVGGPAL